MYVRFMKTSDASSFATGSLNFYISGSIRRKKALETGKCSVV